MSENVETVIRFRADTSDFFREINRIRTSVDDIRSIKEKTLATTKEDVSEQIRGTKGVFQRFKQIRNVNSEIQKSLDANRENLNILKEQRDITLENFRLAKSRVDSNVAKKAELERNVNDLLEKQVDLRDELEQQQALVYLMQDNQNDIVQENLKLTNKKLKIEKELLDTHTKIKDLTDPIATKNQLQKNIEYIKKLKQAQEDFKDAIGSEAEDVLTQQITRRKNEIVNFKKDTSEAAEEVRKLQRELKGLESKRKYDIQSKGASIIDDSTIASKQKEIDAAEVRRVNLLNKEIEKLNKNILKIRSEKDQKVEALMSQLTELGFSEEELGSVKDRTRDLTKELNNYKKMFDEVNISEKERADLIVKTFGLEKEIGNIKNKISKNLEKLVGVLGDENEEMEYQKDLLLETKIAYTDLENEIHAAQDRLARFANSTLQSISKLKEIRKTLASFGIDLTEVNHNIDNLTKSFISMRDNLDFFQRGRLFVEQLKHGVGELKDKLVDMGKYLGDKANKYDYFNYRENKKNLQALQRDMAQQANLLRENEKEILAAQKLQESVMINKAGRAQVRGGATVELPDGSIAKGGDLLADSFKNTQKDTEKIIRTKEMENKAIISGLKDQKDEQNRLQGEIKDTRLAYAAMAAAAVGALNYIKNATPELGAQTKIINHEFRMMAREIGRELVPMFKEFAKVAKSMRQWFKEQPDFVKKSIAVFFMLVTVMLLVGTGAAALSFIFGGLATVFGAVATGAVVLGSAFKILALGQLATATGTGVGLATALSKVGTAIGAIFSPIGLLIAAIAATIIFMFKFKESIDFFSGGIEKAEKSTMPIVRILGAIGKALFVLAMPLYAIAAGFRWFFTLLTKGWDEAKKQFFDEMRIYFEQAGAYVYDLFIAPMIYAWENWLKPTLEKGASYFDQFDNNVSETIRNFMAVIDNMIERIVDFFNHTSLHDALETATGYFSNFFSNVGDGFKDWWNGVSEWIDKLTDKLDLSDKLEEMVQNFKDKFNDIKDFFSGLGDSIADTFSTMFDNMKAGAMELGSKLISFLADKGIVSKINDMIDATVDNISGFLRGDVMKVVLGYQHEDIISKYIEPIRNFKIDLPELATGTLEVPEDMNARIHKGEMIVPATFAEGIRNIMNGTGGSVGSTVNLTFNVQVVEAGNADLVAKKVTDQVMDEINRQVNWQ